MQKLSQQYALLESKYQMANNEVNASGEDMEAQKPLEKRGEDNEYDDTRGVVNKDLLQ